ncbi:hypothetical protein BDK51DRAFT_28373, partial [Blyttiomyces helicus]
MAYMVLCGLAIPLPPPSFFFPISLKGAVEMLDKKESKFRWREQYRPAVFLLVVACVLNFFFRGDSSSLSRPSRENAYLFSNGVVHTVDPAKQIASAFVVRDGHFVGVGAEEEMRRDFPDAKRVDLGRRLVTPGLIDAHAHLLHQGAALIAADLTGSSSLADIRSRLMTHFRARPPREGEWLLGRGWDQNRWEGGRFPNALEKRGREGYLFLVLICRNPLFGSPPPPFQSDIDSDPLLASVPVALYRIDFHAIWLNAKAIALVRRYLPADLEHIDGGQVVLDERGEPAGTFIDMAMTLV